MSNIVPFESAALPAHLAASAAAIEDLFAGTGGGFPVISIKGKVFTLRRGEDRTIITRELDGEQVSAQSIDLVILRAQKGVAKTYYASGYTEGADGAPDCQSANGIEPDAASTSPQAKKCAICPHNQWGSKISEGGKELKACQDNKRLAVAPADNVKDAMLLRVPPASFKALDEYAKQLKTRGVGYNAVLTKVSFVQEAATPQLKFRPVGFLDAPTFTQVSEMANDDVVQKIVGILPSDNFETAAPKAEPQKESGPSEEEVAAAAEAAAQAKRAEEAAKKAKAEAAAKKKAEEAAAKKAAEEATAKAAAKEPAAAPLEVDLDDALSAALAEIDGLNFDA